MRRALMLRQPREGSLLHRRCQCLPSHRCPSRLGRTGARVSQLQALQSCVVGHTDLQLVSLELDVVWPLKKSLLLATQLCGTEPCLPSRANGWHVPKGQTGWRTRRKKAVSRSWCGAMCVRWSLQKFKSFRRRRDTTAWCGPHWWQSGEWWLVGAGRPPRSLPLACLCGPHRRDQRSHRRACARSAGGERGHEVPHMRQQALLEL
jgi:hypothetical protein